MSKEKKDGHCYHKSEERKKVCICSNRRLASSHESR